MIALAFDGIDGAGKTTSIDTVKKYYEEKGKTVVIIRGRPIINTKFDEIEFPSMNDNVLFFLHLARLQSMEQKIFECLRQKVDVVILDRFFDSAFVYSKLLKLKKSKRKAYTGILYKYYHASFKPDVTFYCTAPLKDIQTRLNARDEKRKVHDLKFANKVFIERARCDDNQHRVLVICNGFEATNKLLYKTLNGLDKPKEAINDSKCAKD